MRRPTLLRALLATAVAAVALAGCGDDPILEAPATGPGATTPGGAVDVAFDVSSDGVTPQTVTVPLGAPVSIEATSTDGRDHDLVVVDGLGPGKDATATVPADATETVEVGPFDPGRYAVVLADGGGEEAAIVVEE